MINSVIVCLFLLCLELSYLLLMRQPLLHLRAGARVPFSGIHTPGFAQRNRIYWLCGKSGANRAGARAAFSDFHAPGFAQGNRIYWLCGKSGANRAGARAALSEFQARGFAYENRIYWFCRQAYANRAGARAACFLCAARAPLLVRLADGFHDVFRPHNGNAGQGKLAVLLR